MQDSEKLNAYDAQRRAFRPYGLTCELWQPDIMRKPDRHNEVEINYFKEGSLSYLFQGSKITIPERSMTMFWGLVPHQIVDFSANTPYFVCTIPLTLFLEWRLPVHLTDRVLNGDIVIEKPGDHSDDDVSSIKNWTRDLASGDVKEVTLLEIHARLLRLADRILPTEQNSRLQIHTGDISKVERIALYIAQHYCHPIKAIDIGKEVGLHPDYANFVFKKAFGTTINEYIIRERISHAQRKLISTDESISEILYACGFNSISRFNAAFRKINSCTPRDYRKNYYRSK